MIISYAGGSYAEVTAINGNQVTLDKTLSSTALTNAPAYVLSGGYALGSYSHSEGYGTIAIGDASHAEGVATIAASNNQHAQGRHNIEDSANKYAHIVGNGSSAATRSNAHTLDWDGNAWFAGKIKIGGTGYDDASAVEVALKSDLENISDVYVSVTRDNYDNVTADMTYDKIIERLSGSNTVHCVFFDRHESPLLLPLFSQVDGRLYFVRNIVFESVSIVWSVTITPDSVSCDVMYYPLVKTINGKSPDDNGNVEIAGVNVELDVTLTQSGKSADAKAVGDALAEKSQVQIITWEDDD